ncbi:MAG: DJ-1/PfpI family protein [Anaerolineaceae bacterium]|nr:DJ-1/PfpI family protein [Anaerolineaceae bacterium]
MVSTNNVQKKNIAILISPGFSENEVVYCLSQMRACGLPIRLVGVSNSLVHSQHGLSVKPDLALNDLTNMPPFKMVIIPGSYECVTNLLTSPDFHAQTEKSIAEGGRIAVFDSAKGALQQVPLFATHTEQILYQQRQALKPFCQELIQIATTL